MGKTIYISDELHEFLNKKYRGDSMDSTIKKLLHLETFQGGIINKQIPRGRLAPLENYYWPILNSINLPRKEMQKQVANYLLTSGHFDQYPDELIKLNPKGDSGAVPRNRWRGPYFPNHRSGSAPAPWDRRFPAAPTPKRALRRDRAANARDA